jgi:hypothetical protein
LTIPAAAAQLASALDITLGILDLCLEQISTSAMVMRWERRLSGRQWLWHLPLRMAPIRLLLEAEVDVAFTPEWTATYLWHLFWISPAAAVLIFARKRLKVFWLKMIVSPSGTAVSYRGHEGSRPTMELIHAAAVLLPVRWEWWPPSRQLL